MARSRNTLPAGTTIANYRIGRAIGKGGFSLIYLAVDEETGDEVVVKEFMPKKLVRRTRSLRLTPSEEEHTERVMRGRKLFCQEARALASLHHPNIVRVRGFFLANNTAYLVMQYERGKNLGGYVNERKGGLSTSFVFQVFLPVLDALSLMHSRSILHLDVKPGNIHLRHGNDPLLLDFGAVHLLSHGRAPGGQVITAGYSPLEQYYRGGQIGPWTDVYAVGASIRTCIEGKTPPPAVDRHNRDTLVPSKRKFRDRYPLFLLEAVDWAMEMEPTRRPQNASDLLGALEQFSDELPRSRTQESRPTTIPFEDGHAGSNQRDGFDAGQPDAEDVSN
ncbi:MAG: serine/threonine protein kinase [Chromatiaceae bacterium]|nr:serine/threonine protein kinase [Chromatiaceae bacterium]